VEQDQLKNSPKSTTIIQGHIVFESSSSQLLRLPPKVSRLERLMLEMTWLKRIQLIDTHCHLDDTEFDADRDDIIRTARDRGIHIITSSIEPTTWQKGLAMAELWDNVDVSIGCNPVKFMDANDAISFIKAHSGSIIAIGEVGLDHYYERDHKSRDRQEIVFRKFIETAKDLDVPIQIHSRSAGKAALDVLYSTDVKQVQMHAFDGKEALARTASYEYGFYFSIPTSIVRSPQKRKLVRAVDIEHLLLETDSPVLGPDKTERNTPTNLHITLSEVASILRREEEEIREIILGNTLRLYTKIKTN